MQSTNMDRIMEDTVNGCERLIDTRMRKILLVDVMDGIVVDALTGRLLELEDVGLTRNDYTIWQEEEDVADGEGAASAEGGNISESTEGTFPQVDGNGIDNQESERVGSRASELEYSNRVGLYPKPLVVFPCITKKERSAFKVVRYLRHVPCLLVPGENSRGPYSLSNPNRHLFPLNFRRMLESVDDFWPRTNREIVQYTHWTQCIPEDPANRPPSRISRLMADPTGGMGGSALTERRDMRRGNSLFAMRRRRRPERRGGSSTSHRNSSFEDSSHI